MSSDTFNIRAVLIIAVHLVIIVISLAIALWLRFDSLLSDSSMNLFIVGLTIMVPTKLTTFVVSGLHKGWLRSVRVVDLVRIFVANLAASGGSTLGIFMWIGPTFPRSIYAIDFAVCLVLCAGARAAARLFQARGSAPFDNRGNHVKRDEPRQPYPRWIPDVLLSLTALLLMLSAILGVSVYRLATRPHRLEDLSAAQRQDLIQLADQIVPPVYQPFPLSGQLLFYHMRPSTHYVNVLRDTFTTNDLGFRTIPTGPKPKGVRRIILVGDSWTFGQGVHYEETFAYQLQKILNRNGDRWQVYNLSMPGWNTENEIAALRTFFSRLHPDAVVFCPTSNDIDDSNEVWNGRLILHGFVSGATFRSSYEYHTRWIRAFQSLQSEIDWLKERGVPSMIYFIGAAMAKVSAYYAPLSGLSAPYTAVPAEYVDKKHQLSPDLDPGGHATPEGHRLIAAHLHNALLQQQIVTGLEELPDTLPVVFPGHPSAGAELDEEFRSEYPKRSDLIPLTDDFVGREGLFSVEAPSGARTVYVRLSLIDDPALYPLTVEVGLESKERVSLTKVFDRFVAGPQVIEISKPSSLNNYPTIEVRVTADRVVVPPNGLIPVSMKRPYVQMR